MSDEEDYFDEMDALTAFLDDDEIDRNPYDVDDCVKSIKMTPSNKVAESQNEKTSQESSLSDAGCHGNAISNENQETGLLDGSTDEEKSKEELIDELNMMREQLKNLKQTNSAANGNKDQSMQELFSQALSGSPVNSAQMNKKKTASGKTKHSSTLQDSKKLKPPASTLQAKQNGMNTKSQFSSRSKETVESSEQAADENTKREEDLLQGKDQITSRPEKETTTETSTSSKKSFLKMFGTLENADEEDEDTELNEEGVSKSTPAQKNDEPEDKPSTLAGGSSSFYAKKRTAHPSKNPSPEADRLKPKAGFQKSIRSYGSEPTSKVSSTQDPWELETCSGIKISNPVVSMKSLKMKMQQRKIIRLSILRRYINGGDVDGDWVTLGVIISKSSPKTSKAGKQFSIWKLNDLSPNCPTVSLFLFGKSHEEHWKTVEGSVVGLLNGKILPAKDASEDISVSVDNPQRLLILGKSKDLGWCKGSKKDGGRCTKFVNKSVCEWCEFHIQSQYKKQCSRRTDLQASYSGLNPTAALMKATRNVIYGGVQYNTAKPKTAKTKNPNKKMIMKSLGSLYKDEVKDELKTKCVTLHGKDKLEDDTLVSVSGSTEQFHSLLSKPSPGSQNFIRHMVNIEQSKNVVHVAAKDLLKQHKDKVSSLIKARKRTAGGEIVKKSNKENRPTLSKESSRSEEEKEQKRISRQEMILKKLKNEMKSSQREEKPPIEGEGPKLGADLMPGDNVELDVKMDGFSSKGRHRRPPEELAKAKALLVVKRKGQFQKKDPNQTHRTKKPLDEKAITEIRRKTEVNRKSSSDENADEEQPKKKRKKMVLGEMIDLDSDEMKEILEGSSVFKGALRELEAEMEEKYFNEMEQKEKLELRMDSIMEKEVKVVSCKQCNFTWFCPSSLCKSEDHKVNWHNATQRFFKCEGCSLRTISFFRYPTRHCRNCRGGKFSRVSMLNVKEKKNETLLVRGEERKWVT